MQLSHTCPSNVVLNHWELLNVFVDYVNNTANCTLAGYLTKADYTAGATPVIFHNEIIPVPTNVQANKFITDLKTTTFFSTAIDD
jgi:hypothetical protein